MPRNDWLDPATADWLSAVGHSHRVAILRYFLAAGTATPTEVADALMLPLGTVSYHIRVLARRGILRLAGRTQRRGASVHHYQLPNRARVVSVLWGVHAALLVTDIERDHGRSDATATLDTEALDAFHHLTSEYIKQLGELGLQTRERRGTDAAHESRAREDMLTKVAVLLTTDPDQRGGTP